MANGKQASITAAPPRPVAPEVELLLMWSSAAGRLKGWKCRP
jgi:hypothetical protein